MKQFFTDNWKQPPKEFVLVRSTQHCTGIRKKIDTHNMVGWATCQCEWSNNWHYTHRHHIKGIDSHTFRPPERLVNGPRQMLLFWLARMSHCLPCAGIFLDPWRWCLSAWCWGTETGKGNKQGARQVMFKSLGSALALSFVSWHTKTVDSLP